MKSNLILERQIYKNLGLDKENDVCASSNERRIDMDDVWKAVRRLIIKYRND